MFNTDKTKQAAQRIINRSYQITLSAIIATEVVDIIDSASSPAAAGRELIKYSERLQELNDRMGSWMVSNLIMQGLEF